MFRDKWIIRFLKFPFCGDFSLHLHKMVKEISRKITRGGGRKGGTNTAIPHMVAREYRNTASQFTQIPKPQLPMGKS